MDLRNRDPRLHYTRLPVIGYHRWKRFRCADKIAPGGRVLCFRITAFEEIEDAELEIVQIAPRRNEKMKDGEDRCKVYPVAT